MKSCSMVVTTVAVVLCAFVSTTNVRAVAQTTATSAEAKPAVLAETDSNQTSGMQTLPALPPAGKSAMPVPVLSSPLTIGVALVAEIDNTLNAKKLKPGDKIKGVLTQDLVLQGKIIAPVDTKIVGHVTEAKGATDSDPSSRLGIVFDKLLLKHHQQLDFVAVVQALAHPAQRRSRVDQPSQMLPPAVMGAGSQSNTIGPAGPSRTAGGTQNRPPTQSVGAASLSSLPAGVPVTVKTNLGSSVTGVDLPSGGRPIGAGLPQGVFGLPGLSLSATSTAETPGPVILSKSGSIKLEYGTQVLLRISGPPLPATH